jgi:hypothetical protein
MVVLLATFLLSMETLQPAPSPTLKTIIRVHSSSLCTTLKSSVLYLTQGLQANDRLVENSKPLLLQMGSDFLPVSEVGKSFGKRQSRFGGAHDPSAALLLDNQHLMKLASEIVHNLAIIDAALNDPTRFPPTAMVDDDRDLLLLKTQLQAIADQQRKVLNMLYGLSDTLSLQGLVAQGDGLQGTSGGGGAKAQGGQGDQDISFQDVLSAADRGRSGPVDPTVDQDPAVSQAPSALANNPMVRFYLGVAEDQKGIASAEIAFTQTVVTAAKTCY